jgi:hypothetical protein
MSRRIARVEQDENEAVAYTLNWAGDLNGSTLSTVTWSVPSGLTNELTSNTTTTASIRLSGGTPGQEYKIECSVTSASGEDMQAHFLLRITA